MEHIAIQKGNWTFDGWKTLPVLCRCRQKRGIPYGRVARGGTVFLLMSGEGIVARATVSSAVSKEYGDISEIRDLCKGTSLYAGKAYGML